MRDQVDALAPSPCVYGQAGERLCGGQFFQPAWCCGQRSSLLKGIPDPEMST